MSFLKRFPSTSVQTAMLLIGHHALSSEGLLAPMPSLERRLTPKKPVDGHMSQLPNTFFNYFPNQLHNARSYTRLRCKTDFVACLKTLNNVVNASL